MASWNTSPASKSQCQQPWAAWRKRNQDQGAGPGLALTLRSVAQVWRSVPNSAGSCGAKPERGKCPVQRWVCSTTSASEEPSSSRSTRWDFPRLPGEWSAFPGSGLGPESHRRRARTLALLSWSPGEKRSSPLHGLDPWTSELFQARPGVCTVHRAFFSQAGRVNSLAEVPWATFLLSLPGLPPFCNNPFTFSRSFFLSALPGQLGASAESPGRVFP